MLKFDCWLLLVYGSSVCKLKVGLICLFIVCLGYVVVFTVCIVFVAGVV